MKKRKGMKGKPSVPKKPTAGQRILAAIAELSTPEAINAALTGVAPPGAPFSVTRIAVERPTS